MKLTLALLFTFVFSGMTTEASAAPKHSKKAKVRTAAHKSPKKNKKAKHKSAFDAPVSSQEQPVPPDPEPSFQR